MLCSSTFQFPWGCRGLALISWIDTSFLEIKRDLFNLLQFTSVLFIEELHLHSELITRLSSELVLLFLTLELSKHVSGIHDRAIDAVMQD